MGHVAYFRIPTDCCAHRRHHSGTPVGDGLHNMRTSTLAQPGRVGVCQVWKPLATSAIRAVALRAVVHEQPLTSSESTRVFDQGFNGLGRKCCIKWSHLCS